MTRWLVALFLALMVGASWADVRFDFETGDLQGWRVVSGRFGKLVSDRAMSRNTPGMPYPKQGRFYLSTTELADGGYDDGMTGRIESPAIRMRGARIRFRIGGGAHPDTRVVLYTDDEEEVLSARGANSEIMRQVEWLVPHLKGRVVYLAVEDGNMGSWGHVTLDDVQIEGEIDREASARMIASADKRAARRAERERRREAARAEARRKHRQQLQTPAYLMARGSSRVYRGDALEAISIPMGGIGTGCIQISGHGRLALWQIWGNHKAVELPRSYLVLRCETKGSQAVLRRLEGRPRIAADDADAPPHMASVTFRGEYPFGWWSYRDPEVPLDVEVEAFSPLIPGNARDSALPCIVFRVTLTNRSRSPVRAAAGLQQQNGIGCSPDVPIEGDRSAAYGGAVNRHVMETGKAMVVMSRQDHVDTMAICALGSDCGAETFKPSPSPEGETLTSAVWASMELRPGESRTSELILAWHSPSAVHGGDIAGWTSRGYMYENHYADAEAVARDVATRLPELLRATRLYHDTLYASNLPVWLLDRISSQVAILRSPTVFWGKDGYLGGWEGCSPGKGCCAGNCNHVWHYAQAHARLWPELGRRMREQELAWMKEDGAVPHRQPDAPPAFDGQCGTILGAYREHLLSADDAWLRRHWPRVRQAVQYVIARWDPDEDGILSGAQWNTLDENLGGSSSWLGSLYIASLMAGERMATLMGETDLAAKWRRIRLDASRRQDATLFNGRYYIQIPEETPYRDYGTGCHIDQVLGEWWSRMLDMERVYPEERVRSALRALFEHNFRYDFVGVPQSPRKFVHDDDAGMQMITWPRGGRPAPEHQMLYADEVMTGFEYSAASAMIYAGLLQEGLTVARAIADRYDGRLREGLTASDFASWGYSGNPFGDDECGKFYARAMSSWSLLLACQGLIYDGPAGILGFRPRWKPENHTSFFTTAEGWGLFSQRRTKTRQKAIVQVRYGRLRLNEVILELPQGTRFGSATVRVGGRIVPASAAVEGRDVRIRLERPVTLNTETALEVTLSLR